MMEPAPPQGPPQQQHQQPQPDDTSSSTTSSSKPCGSVRGGTAAGHLVIRLCPDCCQGCPGPRAWHVA
jgi:hypothetical protein